MHHILVTDFRDILTPFQADMAFVDPPYNIGQDYGPGQTDRLPDAEFVTFLRSLAKFLYQSLTPTGTAYVMMNDAHTADLALALTSAGFHHRRLIVWHETFGQYTPHNFSPCARFIHYVVKHPQNFIWTPPLIPSARQTKYNDKRANPTGRVPSSVWSFSRVCGTYHARIKGGAPNQLPIDLIMRTIKTSCPPAGLVLDCCAGNFTTGIAAHKLGCGSILIEKNPDFAAVGSHALHNQYVRKG